MSSFTSTFLINAGISLRIRSSKLPRTQKLTEIIFKLISLYSKYSTIYVSRTIEKEKNDETLYMRMLASGLLIPSRCIVRAAVSPRTDCQHQILQVLTAVENAIQAIEIVKIGQVQDERCQLRKLSESWYKIPIYATAQLQFLQGLCAQQCYIVWSAEGRDSHCPYLLSSETTAKGTGLAESAGKEDPVELDSSLTL